MSYNESIKFRVRLSNSTTRLSAHLFKFVLEDSIIRNAPWIWKKYTEIF